MNRKMKVALAVTILASFVGGSVFYLKANDTELIRANLPTILRACDLVGLTLVSEYHKDSSKNKIRLTFDQPQFPTSRISRAPLSSLHPKAPGYLNYTVKHKEGFSKGLKTYNDSFTMGCKLGDDQVLPQTLDASSQVIIYFNPNGVVPTTLVSTLGDGAKTKNLDSAEDGGMSYYEVYDGASEMVLKVMVRWNKNGKSVCYFKGMPFKDLPKSDPKYQVVTPGLGEMPIKDEQWYSPDDANPLVAITIGTESWYWDQVAYTGSSREKVNDDLGQTAESWTAKGKTAWWGNF